VAPGLPARFAYLPANGRYAKRVGEWQGLSSLPESRDRVSGRGLGAKPSKTPPRTSQLTFLSNSEYTIAEARMPPGECFYGCDTRLPGSKLEKDCGANSTEHTHRPALKSLLESRCRCCGHNEPKRVDCGAPDS